MPSERFETKKPEIPTGKGREVSEALSERLLLFEKVKNQVAFVNEKVILPLKLEKGKESPLGLFVKAAIPEAFQRKVGEQRLEVSPSHGRSALLGRVIFKDKEDRLYRDIDVCGIGYIKEGKSIRKPISGLGLLESDDAFSKHKFSEKFLSAGIRTSRTLAIINLEELVVEDKKISLDEARKKEIIKEKFQPVVEVRGFGTKARIEDLFHRGEWPEKKFQELPLEDAITLVSQEMGRGDNPLSKEEYLEWFAEALGKNIGLMHKNGWLHRNLIPHNFTLDCRIVDLDTVKQLKNDDERLEDLDAAEDSYQSLIFNLRFFDKTYELLNRFRKSYNSVFPPKERECFFADLKNYEK